MKSFSRSLLCALSVLAATLLVAEDASAARLSVAARGLGPGSDRAAALVGHYAREAFGRDDKFEVVPVIDTSNEIERARALRWFAEADEQLTRARAAYDSLDLDAADAALKSAQKLFERSAAYINDFKKLADIYLLLGATSILRGDEASGTQYLEHALNVFSQSEPDPRIFNPSMRTQFAQVASRLGVMAPGALAVSSTPGYSEVFVDGKFAGVTPVVIDKLSVGRHVLRVQRDGHKPFGKIVTIDSRSEASEAAMLREVNHLELFELRIDDAVNHIDASSRQQQQAMGRDRRDLTKLAKADEVFIARVRLLGERVQIQAEMSKADGTVIKSGSHTFAYDTRPQTFEHEVAVLLQSHFNLDVTTSTEQRQSDDKTAAQRQKGDDHTALPHAGSKTMCLGGTVACRGLKIAVSTTALTLGVGGVVVGALEYALAAHTHKTWQSVVQTSSEMGVLRARGRQQALVGDIAMGVGAALILTGSLTLALWHPTPSVSDVSLHGKDPGAIELGPRSELHIDVSPMIGHKGGMLTASLTF